MSLSMRCLAVTGLQQRRTCILTYRSLSRALNAAEPLHAPGQPPHSPRVGTNRVANFKISCLGRGLDHMEGGTSGHTDQSTDMGERYPLKGIQLGMEGKQIGSRIQDEQDKLQVKKIDKTIQRLEGEIGISEDERSKSILKQDGDAVKYIVSRTPELPELYSRTPTTASGDQRLLSNAAYTMEVNVGKDRKKGDGKVPSVSAVNAEELNERGVKVYDDVQRVMYEVRSGGTTTLENGVHPWSSSEGGELMQHVGHAYGDGASITVTRTDPATAGSSQVGVKGPVVPNQAKVEMQDSPQGMAGPSQPSPRLEYKVSESTEVVFVGEEEPRVLGFDGTVQADIVLIDEDDDRSLREKTVTDVSTMDGNAADLVAGRPLSVSSELSSEEKEETSIVELPPPAIQKKKRCRCCTVM
ncbi:hypothetical protein JZ751_027433 [Albula glossodonta]|uniref:Paralemmin-2 n=1 Tax=Albula glossodonta TaxID=121402 RepID=A0A8T2NCA3_9TELE|nr:hypothetical protein JZ751_027433 [Albula glossodonta]